MATGARGAARGQREERRGEKRQEREVEREDQAGPAAMTSRASDGGDRRGWREG